MLVRSCARGGWAERLIKAKTHHRRHHHDKHSWGELQESMFSFLLLVRAKYLVLTGGQIMYPDTSAHFPPWNSPWPASETAPAPTLKCLLARLRVVYPKNLKPGVDRVPGVPSPFFGRGIYPDVCLLSLKITPRGVYHARFVSIMTVLIVQ